MTDSTGRVLTESEASSILSNPIILNGTSYWLGTKKDDSASGIYVVGPGGFIDGLTYSGYYFDNCLGVRPVIVVNTSDIQSN